MTIKRDYYEVLGVPRDATREYIRRTFRRLAFRYHPDRNPDNGAAEKFKEISEAYEVLSDPVRRASYDHLDQRRTGWFDQSFEDIGEFVSDLGEVFETFFGGLGATERRTPQRGADLHHNIKVSFEESVFGCEKEIDISRAEHCPTCRGMGYEPGTEPVTCLNCNGTGKVKRMQQSVFGCFVNVVACDRCHGQGNVIVHRCSRCGGTGEETRQKRISLRIAPGIENGAQMRLDGEGAVGTFGGPRGNVYINISVSPHHSFRRDGDDIAYELPLSFPLAALGGEIAVPTLEGSDTIQIPPGTQTGEVFRLTGKGVPHARRSGRGDQVVRVKVITPQNLTREQRRLFSKLAEMLEA